MSFIFIEYLTNFFLYRASNGTVFSRAHYRKHCLFVRQLTTSWNNPPVLFLLYRHKSGIIEVSCLNAILRFDVAPYDTL